MARKKSEVDIFEHEVVEEYCVKPLFDSDGVQLSSAIGKDGREYPDPVPLGPPVGYKAPRDLMTMIKEMVRNERFLSEIAKEGYETFEESDDFEIDDDPLDPLTDYEMVFEAPPVNKSGNGAEGPVSTAKTDGGGAEEGAAGSSQKGTPPEPAGLESKGAHSTSSS